MPIHILYTGMEGKDSDLQKSYLDGKEIVPQKMLSISPPL